MAYTINKFDGTLLSTVSDGTIDQTTSLRFVGKNYAGYGEIQNENFLHLLESFASSNSPARPVSGQLWFDAGSNKLKFYDGTKFKTTGGAEVSATQPTGLVTGDFWWDTSNEQLYAFNGSSFTLIGPQGVGDSVTQLRSRTIIDTTSASQLIIEAVVNDEVIYVISQNEFTISTADPANVITGFDVIRKGLTLKNTQNATNGITSTDHQYHGTASNSLRFGGKLPSEFLTSGGSVFQGLARFSDSGFLLGDDGDLRVDIQNDNEVHVGNEIGDEIVFKVNASGPVTEIARITSEGFEPSTVGVRTVGTATNKWDEMHATSFKGNADTSTGILAGGQNYAGNIGAVANTTPLRDSAGNISAVVFNGIASQANYADLAEKYSTDKEYEVGTVMTINTSGSAEMTACDENGQPLGVISENPAFLMNKDAEGQSIALVGRVPVKVVGAVKKGDKVYASVDGTASTDGENLVGYALESNDDVAMKKIEVMLKL